MSHSDGIEGKRFFLSGERLSYVLSGVLFLVLILTGVAGLLSASIFGS